MLIFRFRTLAPIAVLLTLALGGCSSLERSGELQNNALRANISSKNQVVDAIGLPIKTEKDETRGVERWFYTGRPISTSYFVPLPIGAAPAGPNMTTIFYADIGEKNLINNQPVVLVCVFDRDGRLIEIQKPQSEKSK